MSPAQGDVPEAWLAGTRLLDLPELALHLTWRDVSHWPADVGFDAGLQMLLAEVAGVRIPTILATRQAGRGCLVSQAHDCQHDLVADALAAWQDGIGCDDTGSLSAAEGEASMDEPTNRSDPEAARPATSTVNTVGPSGGPIMFVHLNGDVLCLEFESYALPSDPAGPDIEYLARTAGTTSPTRRAEGLVLAAPRGRACDIRGPPRRDQGSGRWLRPSEVSPRMAAP